MSSIISDIFYGSKRSLLDQYLQRQQQQPSHGSQKQWMLADQLSISMPKSPINQSDNINEQSSIKKSNKQEELYNINISIHNSQQKKQEGKLYEVSLQMGRKINKQLIHLKNVNDSDNNEVVFLQQCSLEQVQEHSNLKLEMVLKQNYQNVYTKVKKGFGFIPIEVIKQCLSALKSKQIISKQMQLTLKGNLSFNKVKLQIFVTQSQLSQFQPSFPQQPFQSFDQSHSNVVMQPKRQRYYLKPFPKKSKPKYSNKSSSKSKQRASYSNKTQLQMIQQINKETINSRRKAIDNAPKQIKNTHKIEKANFVVHQIEQFNKREEALNWLLHVQGDTKNYSINQTIQTYFSGEGLKLIIMKQINENQEIKFGVCSLNPLVLLNMSTRQFQAQFPICDDNSICKGLLKISNTQKKQQQFQKAIDSKIIKQQSPIIEYQTVKITSKYSSIIAIQFSKILIYFPWEQLKKINQKSNLIVRSKYQLQNHEIIFTKLQQRNLFSVQLKNQEKFIVLKCQETSYLNEVIEFQIMEDRNLISYSKLSFNFKGFEKGIKWFHGYLDGGMNQGQPVLCSTLIKGAILKYQPQYFQQKKINNILQLITHVPYLQKLLELKYQQNTYFQQSLYNLISTFNSQKDNKITFVECQRLANMIKQFSEQPSFQFFLQCTQEQTKSDYNDIANNEQIQQQLKYLDQKFDGFVDFTIWKQIASYYEVSDGQEWKFSYDESSKGFTDEVLRQKMKNKAQNKLFLPYIFLLAGLTLTKFQVPQQPIQQKQQYQIHQQKQTSKPKQLQQLKEQTRYNLHNQNLKTVSNHKSPVYIEQIQCKNFHMMMPNQKVPSCFVSLCPSRVQYSNANPVFKIHNYIEDGTIIKFFNKNIKNPKQQHLLATIILDKHRSKYLLQAQTQIFIRFNSQKKIKANVAQ